MRGVPENQGTILFPANNFWGRSISAVSSSTDPESRKGFGPFTPGFSTVEYGSLEDLERALDADPNVIALMAEPIQGEAGVVVPPEGYLRGAQELLHSRGALLIADEVQTGLGRTGKWLASHYERNEEDPSDDWRPDMLVLGKALSGGVFPVSAMLASSEVMLAVRPGQHGSTYGGNPLGAAVAMEALAVLQEEGMVENAARMGDLLRSQLSASLLGEGSQVLEVRGKGLLNAVVIRPGEGEGAPTAWEVCLAMKERGVLAKPTHGDIIRLAPPLTIGEADVETMVQAVRGGVQDVFGEHAVPAA